MFRKITLLLIFIFMGYALWISPTFKEVAAGIAILLFGMILLEAGFKALSEGPLEKLIKKATNKLSKSIALGGVATAILQSSSLITVVTISFISAGLIGLKSGIGLIYGANIGTTATAWLVAGLGLKIKIDLLALPMLVFGVVLFFQKNRNLKGVGNVLAGLGFFFLGVHYMKEGFDAFESTINLAEYSMPGLKGIVVYTVIGILITLILQSSSATMALILTALAVGQITYLNSLSLAIGANIGTTITAILGSISANTSGKRLAGAHLVFNLATGAFAIIFIHAMADIVDWLSIELGIKANDYTLKLSLFHTMFNIVGVLLLLPFTNRLIRMLERMIKEKPDEGVEHPKYLNKISLDYPAAAIKALLNESKYLLENAAFEIVSHGLHLHREDIKSDQKLGGVVKASRDRIKINVDELYFAKVKVIYSKIIEYAALVQQQSLSAQDVELLAKIKLANRYIVEAIKATRGLHRNVGEYLGSEDQIGKEYDRLRKKGSKVLREIYQTRKDEHPATHSERLEKLKEKAIKSDLLMDGTLDNLIGSGSISGRMATSLINDSDTVASICRYLIEAAELLYIQSDTLLKENGNTHISENDISM